MQQAVSGTGENQLWAVVLAGGEGVRLQPLIRRLYGEPIPKQYAALIGSRSLLRQTVDRVRLIVSGDRIVVVTLGRHRDYLREALDGAPLCHILEQPEDKETSVGVLFPTHWIHGRDPEAVVAVFPSDHFLKEEQPFMEHVADIVEVVRGNPEWIVLLGAPPSDPEPDYGWIEPGKIVGWSPLGEPISAVRRFVEKPSPLTAHTCFEKGWLWNTFVLVAKASRLLEVGRCALPQTHEAFRRICAVPETGEVDAETLRRAYASFSKVSFSRAILELCPPGLVVSRIPPITWSDWGTPERVLKSLKKAGLLPRWFGEADLASYAPTKGREREEEAHDELNASTGSAVVLRGRGVANGDEP